MPQYDKADIERRMAGAVESLKGDLGGLRTGRANTSLLDPVVVEVYGSMMPLASVATVNAPEPRMLSVQVWDKSNLTAVEKGIAHANLGLNPMIDGQTLFAKNLPSWRPPGRRCRHARRSESEPAGRSESRRQPRTASPSPRRAARLRARFCPRRRRR